MPRSARLGLLGSLSLLAFPLLAQVPQFGIDTSPWGCQTIWPNNGSLSTFFDRLDEAGVGTVRSDAMWWGLVESTMDQYDFDGSNYPGYSAWNVDNWVAACTSRGLEPYVILGYGNGDLYLNPPADATSRQGYADYCGAAAAQYENEVDIWEIWNEPNLNFFWGATPNAADYTALVASASAAIRANDASTIIVGGVVSGIDMTYLTNCFNQGLLSHIDALSIHPYRTTRPESVNGEIATLRTLMNGYANGSNVAIWTGEWGYNTYFSEVNEIGQAKALLRMMINNLAQGVQLSTWFSVHAFQELDPGGTDSEWGLLNRDLTRRPSFYAMQALNTLLPPPVSHISDPYSVSFGTGLSNQRHEVMERGDTDHRTIALWRADWPVNSAYSPGTTNVSLTVTQDFELWAYDGLTGSPVSLDARWSGGQVTMHGFSMWDYPVFVEVNREELPSGPNVAPSAVATSTDSDFSGAYGADKAIDGVISDVSKWTSQNTAEPHWLALELDQFYDVTGFVLRLPSMGDEFSTYNAIDVEFQVGPTITGPWTTVGSVSNPLQHDRIIATLGVPETTRFVRLLINDAGVDAYARIPEFQVHGAPGVPATLTQLSAE